MLNQTSQQSTPDILFEANRFDGNRKKGKLKIFLGYAAGVGKTYSMLNDAHEKLNSGIDVVVGYIDPHTRPETLKLLEGLPALPPIEIKSRHNTLREFNLVEALERRPELILVDELAHTNASEKRNKKRYQDIEELLNAGIDVYTTVNIQHIESMNDIIQKITKVVIRETIPDYFFDNADTVEIIDISPEELLKRYEEGKIYHPVKIDTAVKHFFTVENLSLLREIATRKAADRISHDNLNVKKITDKFVGTKLMVCIKSSPSSARLIRWTARTAEAFHAPWIAVYVDNMTKENESEVNENLDLAKRLGAETVRLNGNDVVATIAEYAKISGVTNVVIGKTKHSNSIKRLIATDFEEKLIAMMPDVEIHIIPGTPEKSYREKKGIHLSDNLHLSLVDTLKSIGILTAVTIFCMGLQKMGVGDQNIIMIYILSVLIIARTTMGYLYSMVASVLSVYLFNFIFTVPYFKFNAMHRGYPVTVLIMLFAAWITSALTIRVKTQIRISAEREHRTKILYEINKKLLVTWGLDHIIDLTNRYIVKIFDRSVIFYIEDPESNTVGFVTECQTDKGTGFFNRRAERAVAHWVFKNQKPAGAGSDTLMGSKAYYIPIISQGNVLGVIGVSCAKGKLNQNNQLFLRILASLVAMALERQYLSDEQRKIIIESEKEKMRSNLLRAISHDLRTPLTSILGASSAILENKGNFDEDTQNKLLVNIKEDSQWLIHMVENLLSVTRINEGTMHVTKSLEAAEEIAAEAVGQIRKRFAGRKISVKVPDEFLLVPMDGTLIIQVLINLIENAVKNSPEDSVIDVNVKTEGQFAVFEVSDNGKGIPEEEYPYLFESYVPNGKKSSDSSRGMGIGLSICMTIIKAHNGKLEAANKVEGGAIFRFKLPIEEMDCDE